MSAEILSIIRTLCACTLLISLRYANPYEQMTLSEIYYFSLNHLLLRSIDLNDIIILQYSYSHRSIELVSII